MPSLGFTGVTFWSGGTAGALTASAACAVLAAERYDGTAVVCVSDPTRAARAGLTVTWDRPVAAVTTKPATVTSATTGTSLTLTFADLAPTKGATQKVVLRLG